MSNKNTFEIRDLRDQEWVWTHTAILFNEDVDGNTYKVYGGLSSYANNLTQKAFPGINTLARRLHLSRTTVMSSIKKLESSGFILVERTEGEHNVYSLLNVNARTVKILGEEVEETKPAKPRDTARDFFDGVIALMNKEDVPWLKQFLASFSDKYSVEKSIVWGHVRDFSMYWTEKNPTGTKERWELQKTFEVELRLGTWFRRAKIQEKESGSRKGKGRNIVGMTAETV